MHFASIFFTASTPYFTRTVSRSVKILISLSRVGMLIIGPYLLSRSQFNAQHPGSLIMGVVLHHRYGHITFAVNISDLWGPTKIARAIIFADAHFEEIRDSSEFEPGKSNDSGEFRTKAGYALCLSWSTMRGGGTGLQSFSPFNLVQLE